MVLKAKIIFIGQITPRFLLITEKSKRKNKLQINHSVVAEDWTRLLLDGPRTIT
jgi:hypothetical protein